MPALWASVTIFFLVCAAATAIYAALYGKERALDERVADIGMRMRVAYGNPGALDLNSDTAVRALFRWVVDNLPEPKMDAAQAEKLQQMLTQAGYSGSAAAARNFQIIRMGSALLFAIVAVMAAIAGQMTGPKPILLLVMGAAVGAFAPVYFLQRRLRSRQQAIASQLSDILDLLVVCVEVGLGLSGAIKIVGNEAENQGQEIGSELAIVSGELAAGISLGQALRNLAQRTSVDDVKPLAATLIQSEQLGAQIGPALRAISDSLRTARRLRAEEAAQKTTVKILFPLVIFILPAMMSVIVGPAVIQIMHALNQAR